PTGSAAPPAGGDGQRPAATGVAERRTVIVPPEEQLKPEAVLFGVVQDFVAERPWVPWVVVAFLIGYVLGLARRR
ncbi:MAG TPA: carbon monoxide dehydrogenase, partial [Roseiflexaceae bacterium]|nr:carbon monoxide dehydrogenase [Roseiflexaceae bacterium]